jgi:hypothetical protein
LGQQTLDGEELITRKCRLPSSVFRPIVVRQRVGNACLLGFLSDLRLGLSHRRHEGDQRIADRLLHGVPRGAVKGQAIDDGFNANPATDELPHGPCHIDVIAPQSVDPPDNQNVALPQNVEQATTLGAFRQTCGDTRDPMVGNDDVRRKSRLFRLGDLMLDGLVNSTDPTVKDRLHRVARRGVVRLKQRPLRDRWACGRESQGSF